LLENRDAVQNIASDEMQCAWKIYVGPLLGHEELVSKLEWREDTIGQQRGQAPLPDLFYSLLLEFFKRTELVRIEQVRKRGLPPLFTFVLFVPFCG
jgi:hypothetical protein